MIPALIISGVFILIVYGIPAFHRYAALKNCLIKGDATGIDTFTYKGRLYNKIKYINDRKFEIGGKDRHKLLEMLERIQRQQIITPFDRVEIEAIRQTLDNARQKEGT